MSENALNLNENNYQYILDRFVKIDWNLDDYKNKISKKVLNEPHCINQTDNNGYQFISLNGIPDTDATFVVNNKVNILSSNVPSFISYTKVQSLAELTTNNKFYVDTTNARIYFKGVVNNQEIEVTYFSFGKMCLSANMIYTEWDSNGDIIQLLGELVRKAKVSLSQMDGITNAESTRIQMEAQTNALIKMYGIIQEYVPEGKALSAELDIKVPNANTAVTNINNALTNAQNAINTITLADNQYYSIQANELVYNTSNGYYEYTLNHNLNSAKLAIKLKDDDGYDLFEFGREIDSNNYLVKNDEQVNIHVVINKGYYGGA